MVFRGEENSFSFEMDAADTVSYLVIRGSDCADVLRKLAGIIGMPAMLPKWAFGYVQSQERYETQEEILGTAEKSRELGIGMDCIVLDWFSWGQLCNSSRFCLDKHTTFSPVDNRKKPSS